MKKKIYSKNSQNAKKITQNNKETFLFPMNFLQSQNSRKIRKNIQNLQISIQVQKNIYTYLKNPEFISNETIFRLFFENFVCEFVDSLC